MGQQTALIPRAERLRQSGEVFSRLEELEVFRKAANVGLFWSMSDEIPTHDFIDRWASRKNICLPVTEADGMFFSGYVPGCKMVQSGMRMLAPCGTPPVDSSQLDLLVVPGMAFDAGGGRLGRGKGYYDRFIATCRAPRIGICMDHQMVGSVPCEEHDMRVDMVLTASGLYIAADESARGTAGNFGEIFPGPAGCEATA